jgi:hypothetical protein
MVERAQVALLPVWVFAATATIVENHTAKSGCATGHVKFLTRGESK